MKTRFLKLSLMVFSVIFLTSCKEAKENQSVEVNTPEEVKKAEKKVADVADQDFIDGMTGKIWHNYLEIKMALTRDDADKAKDVAKSMADSFSSEREEMKSIAQQLAETDDIEKQRQLFADFTEKAGPMFEEALSKGTIYKKFCPMAFNNKGAYWYADVEEITNPYFGDKMLDCGTVEKTIKK
ncbi:DUF3347 domain-containing protein [Christiangramia crocea]|uniref:DUF3347 domain-containing protein n=1 Tax=Christiangramia crocea TaxID=2904124 RepID=A0A9X1UYU3_9FLAO|nr:DUF3347 domain-containing protein [Gramella crocea]MCG9971818.1 DUF3347 domain-containing protein [Gramella crocea]